MNKKCYYFANKLEKELKQFEKDWHPLISIIPDITKVRCNTDFEYYNTLQSYNRQQKIVRVESNFCILGFDVMSDSIGTNVHKYVLKSLKNNFHEVKYYISPFCYYMKIVKHYSIENYVSDLVKKLEGNISSFVVDSFKTDLSGFSDECGIKEDCLTYYNKLVSELA